MENVAPKILPSIRSLDTAPIKTDLKDSTIAGAGLAQESSSPFKLGDTAAIAKNLSSLRRVFLTRSPSGVISLHQLAPVVRVGHRIVDNKRTVVNRQPYFIAVACNKNEFDNTTADVHVINTGTLAMLERGYEPDAPFNGFTFNGSPSTGLIPNSIEAWNMRLNENDTVGSYLNNIALSAFFNIKKAVAIAENPDTSTNVEEINASIKKAWDKYEKSVEMAVQKGILVESDIVYVSQNSLQPVTTTFQDTTSDNNKYFRSGYMYGTEEAGSSYAPVANFAIGIGVITATQSEPVSGYQYGQFAIGNPNGTVETVAQDDKVKTMETCTREMSVYDESGRRSAIQITVNDIRRGDKPIKRSSNLASLNVGTAIISVGKFLIRTKKKGSLACNFRVSDVDWTSVSSASSSSKLNADVSVSAATFEDFDLDAMVDSFDENLNLGAALDTLQVPPSADEDAELPNFETSNKLEEQIAQQLAEQEPVKPKAKKAKEAAKPASETFEDF